MKINKIYLAEINIKSKIKKSPVRNNYYDETRKVNKLSNVYYNDINFGRTIEEHRSWGAQINPKTKEVTFKIFTFPDAQSVTTNVIKENGSVSSFELENKGKGIFKTEKGIAPGEVKDGDTYYYTITKSDGSTVDVKDPYAYRQGKDVYRHSRLYDHSKYQWENDEKWVENSQKISRMADDKNGYTPLSAASIYELNVATLTKEGTFESAKDKLKKIKEDYGFNAIEIMPVEGTYSINWGYDGVDKLAPSEYLGGPDGLKSLIDYAHSIGLNVIMDMVPNHIGPDCNSLHDAGPYIGGDTDFGPGLNYRGKNSKYVRDFIVNTAMNWVKNYHCDGLRLDMTKYMNSDATMKQIVAEINYHCPDAFLIAEDGRGNNPEITNKQDFVQTKENHCQYIESIEKEEEKARERLHNDVSETSIGFDSEWNFDFSHALEDAVYGRVHIDRLVNVFENSDNRVKYLMSHDEIGNNDGTRLIAKCMSEILNLEDSVEFSRADAARIIRLRDLNYSRLDKNEQTSDKKEELYNYALNTVKYQTTELAAEELAIMIQTGTLTNDTPDSDLKSILGRLGIKRDSGITYSKIQDAFDVAFRKNNMGIARLYSIPGPKMIFQGDENADLTPFRFFRRFSENYKHQKGCIEKDAECLEVEKGYKSGEYAHDKSKLGNIKYSESVKYKMNKTGNLIKELNKLNSENTALQDGKCKVIHANSKNNVISTHAYNEKSEIYAITNFSGEDFHEYYIEFPQGEWEEVINTDAEKYNGSNRYINDRNTKVNYYKEKHPIKLAGYSTIIFKKVK